MRKKIALLALSAAIALTACGGGAPTETTAARTADEAAEAQTTAAPEDTQAEATPEAETTAAAEEESDKPELKEEIVVVDNDECSIKITGIDPDGDWGYAVKVALENKSSDKTYMFSVSTGAVNGVEYDPFFATEIAPGKKSNNTIDFTTSTLEGYGIEKFTDIELSFHVYDSNDWMADAVAEETTHVYPYGEDNAEMFVREPQDSDTVIVDNDYATVIVTGYRMDDIWGYTADMFFVNKTDKQLMFGTDDVSVNGYMADPFFAKSVSPGKCAFGSMQWSEDTFSENGIEEVEDIEFTLSIYDDNDIFADHYFDGQITLNP